MIVTRSLSFRLALILQILFLPAAAFPEPIGAVTGGGGAVQWQTAVNGHDRIVLTVSKPNGEIYSTAFPAGKPVALTLKDLGVPIDGVYTYELRVVPKIAGTLKKRLDGARESDDPIAAVPNGEIVQSGSFAIVDGSIVVPGLEEELSPSSNGARPGTPVPNDQVIPDDLIVQGSTCVGVDCVNGEVFGDDTILLKEINLRIGFNDTSSGGGFPSNDWELKVNDSTSGGQSKISIEDLTGAKTPFTIVANAPTNSFFVNSTGRIGFRTATPAQDLHINTGDTPAIRLEQNAGGGFTAQTFDIGGNEANFFVRDVTAGDTIPFKIKPGAPTNALVVAASGSVGINDLTPNTNAKLDISGAQRFDGISAPTTDNGAWLFNEAGAGFVVQAGGSFRFRTGASSTEKLTLDTDGDLGILCTAPASDFVIASASNCAGTLSSINAGATQFTVTSSRVIKENLEPVDVPDLLARIGNVPVYNYDFTSGPKDRLGLIAEDFHQIFGRGSDKTIDGHEVQMALWLAVQQLTKRVAELEGQLVQSR